MVAGKQCYTAIYKFLLKLAQLIKRQRELIFYIVLQTRPESG